MGKYGNCSHYSLEVNGEINSSIRECFIPKTGVKTKEKGPCRECINWTEVEDSDEMTVAESFAASREYNCQKKADRYDRFNGVRAEFISILASVGIKVKELGGIHHRIVFPNGRYIDFWPSTGALHIPKQKTKVAPRLPKNMESWDGCNFIPLAKRMVKWWRENDR